MRRRNILRCYVGSILALVLFWLSLLVPILLGVCLGVYLERRLGIRSIWVTMPVIAVLLPILPRVVAGQLKGGVLGRALARFVGESDAWPPGGPDDASSSGSRSDERS